MFILFLLILYLRLFSVGWNIVETYLWFWWLFRLVRFTSLVSPRCWVISEMIWSYHLFLTVSVIFRTDHIAKTKNIAILHECILFLLLGNFVLRFLSDYLRFLLIMWSQTVEGKNIGLSNRVRWILLSRSFLIICSV